MKKDTLKVIKIVLVNLITSIRLIGAFVLPYIYIKYGTTFASIFILILFSTDAIDGFFARNLKVSTFFGSIMDVCSDKLLSAVAFIILGIKYHLLLAPLILEVAISYTNYSTYRYGGNVKASITGKIKTLIVDVCVVLSFIILALPVLNINSRLINDIIAAKDLIIYVLCFIILFACLAALLDYTAKNKIARLNPKSKEIKYTVKKPKPIKDILKLLFDTNYYTEHKDESIMKQIYLS